jgi:hypothetical protein
MTRHLPSNADPPLVPATADGERPSSHEQLHQGRSLRDPMVLAVLVGDEVSPADLMRNGQGSFLAYEPRTSVKRE